MTIDSAYDYNMSLSPTITKWLYNQTDAESDFSYNQTIEANLLIQPNITAIKKTFLL